MKSPTAAHKGKVVVEKVKIGEIGRRVVPFTITVEKLTVPVLANIPHSALLIPADIRRKLLISDKELKSELLCLTDRYVDELFSSIPEIGGAGIRYNYSRLVADPERFEDDKKESMAEKGMGVIYTRTSEGKDLRAIPGAAERKRILNLFYRPYQCAVEKETERLLRIFGKCLILDCHSFSSKPLPFEPDQDPDRPDMCIGTDDFHSHEELVQTVETFCRDSRLKVRRNSPYKGTYVPLKHLLGKDKRVSSMMIEIRRGLYMNESSGEKLPSFVEKKVLVSKMVKSIINQYEPH